MRMMSSISRWNLSGGGEDGMEFFGLGRGSIIRRCSPNGVLWSGRLELQKIALHPTLQVVIFGLDLTPRSRRHGLVVACEQHPGALAQHPLPGGLRPRLKAHRDPLTIGIHDARRL